MADSAQERNTGAEGGIGGGLGGLDGGVMSTEAIDALLAAADVEAASQAALFDAASESAGSDGNAEDAFAKPAVALPPFGGSSGGGVFDSPADAGAPGFSRVRDIPLEVTVELGRTRLLIKDILDLSAGSIIELDKVAGEPVDLFANGLLVARGEVIVIDDNFGVRVTEIITAADRIREAGDAHAMAA